MTNQSQKNISIALPLIIAVIGFGLLFVYLISSQPHHNFGDGTFNRFTTSSTSNTSVNCASQQSTAVLTASGGRNYGLFTNDSANNIYLCFAATCASSTGMRLNANGGAYELKYDNLYVGPISCVAATATSTLVVISNNP